MNCTYMLLACLAALALAVILTLCSSCGTINPIDDAGMDCYEAACDNMDELGCNNMDAETDVSCPVMLRDIEDVVHLDPCCLANLTDCDIDVCDVDYGGE